MVGQEHRGRTGRHGRGHRGPAPHEVAVTDPGRGVKQVDGRSGRPQGHDGDAGSHDLGLGDAPHPSLSRPGGQRVVGDARRLVGVAGTSRQHPGVGAGHGDRARTAVAGGGPEQRVQVRLGPRRLARPERQQSPAEPRLSVRRHVGEQGVAIYRRGLRIDGRDPFDERFRGPGEKFFMAELNAGNQLAQRTQRRVKIP